MWETIRGYLTFTRKERIGVLFLLLVIGVLFILPYYFRPAVGDPDPATYEKLKDGIRNFESRMEDSSHASVYHSRYREAPGELKNESRRNPYKPTGSELFYFDPNQTDARGWLRLGLNERQAQTILHYIQKGGRFRKAEDLQKIYGLHPADYNRLLPFVRLTRPPDQPEPGTGYEANNAAEKKRDSVFRQNSWKTDVAFPRMVKKLTPTDINQADAAAWSGLPGIGEKLASRIIRFREKLGGFYSIEQVGETFGLPDSVFQKIKPFLQSNAFALRLTDLNLATKEELQSHPYIRWELARNIIDYRNQHKRFQSVDELLQLARMDATKFEKIKPYVSVDQKEK